MSDSPVYDFAGVAKLKATPAMLCKSIANAERAMERCRANRDIEEPGTDNWIWWDKLLCSWHDTLQTYHDELNKGYVR